MWRISGRRPARVRTPSATSALGGSRQNLRSCHRQNQSQDHHGHLRRGLRHNLGLLDGVLQDEFSGFMVPFSLTGGGLGQGFFFEFPPRGCSLHFPPLAIFLFQPPPQFLGFSPQPLLLPPPSLLFLLLVPGQTLLHGSLSRF